MSIIDDTLKIYQGLAEKSDKCLVAFSGGKDSLVVMDFATRYFRRENISAFFMELLPGIEILDGPIREAEDRLKIPIKRYPHWLTSRILRSGAYCDKNLNIPEWKVNDIYETAMRDAGVDFLITGARAADSPCRRRYIGAHKGIKDHIVYPIVGWGKYDVLGYLKSRGLKPPDSSGSNATGVDLSTRSLLWLYEKHRSDFDTMAEYFPYIEAVIWRERFYGQR